VQSFLLNYFPSHGRFMRRFSLFSFLLASTRASLGLWCSACHKKASSSFAGKLAAWSADGCLSCQSVPSTAHSLQLPNALGPLCQQQWLAGQLHSAHTHTVYTQSSPQAADWPPCDSPQPSGLSSPPGHTHTHTMAARCQTASPARLARSAPNGLGAILITVQARAASERAPPRAQWCSGGAPLVAGAQWSSARRDEASRTLGSKSHSARARTQLACLLSATSEPSSARRTIAFAQK